MLIGFAQPATPTDMSTDISKRVCFISLLGGLTFALCGAAEGAQRRRASVGHQRAARHHCTQVVTPVFSTNATGMDCGASIAPLTSMAGSFSTYAFTGEVENTALEIKRSFFAY